MATLRAGQPVTLRVRRNDQELDITVIPRAGCHRPGILISADAAAERNVREWLLGRSRADSRKPADRDTAVPPVDFGLAVSCGTCRWVMRPGYAEFVTEISPVVIDVVEGSAAADAGVMRGDTLVALEGFRFDGAVPEAVWKALRSGRPTRINIRRGRTVELVIVPRRVRF